MHRFTACCLIHAKPDNDDCQKLGAMMNKRVIGHIKFCGLFILPLFALSQTVFAQQSPVPPLPVPPNASQVTATVLEHAVWPAGSLSEAVPSVATDTTIYSIKLKVHTSEPKSTDLEYLAVPESRYVAYSFEILESELIGEEIQATLELKGTTDSVYWWISNVSLTGGPSK
jgi:hypothetical protein